jgi:FAD synthetase
MCAPLTVGLPVPVTALQLSDWRLERAGRVSAPAEAKQDGQATVTELPQPEDNGSATHAVSTSAEGEVLTAGNDALLRSLSNSRSRSNSFDSGVHSAALVIIGDEILNGFTADVNIQVTAQALRTIGIPLKVVSVISDSVEDISAEVLRMSQKYDVVITSGGIGATHDDVTLKAVAQALNQEIKIHPEMMDHLYDVHCATLPQDGATFTERTLPAEKLDEGMLRLAMLPERSKLRFPPTCGDLAGSGATSSVDTPVGSSNQDDHDPATGVAEGVGGGAVPPPVALARTASAEALRKNWPVLQCDNIFVLPGVPQYYAAKIDIIVRHVLSHKRRQHSRKIVLDLDEGALVSVLGRLVAEHRDVKFGSYPFVDHPEFKTIITLEGADRDGVEAAVAGLLAAVPTNAVLRVEKGMAARRM